MWKVVKDRYVVAYAQVSSMIHRYGSFVLCCFGFACAGGADLCVGFGSFKPVTKDRLSASTTLHFFNFSWGHHRLVKFVGGPTTI